MIEIEIPNSVAPRSISCSFVATIVEQVLKAVLPEEDFSVMVQVTGRYGDEKIVVEYQGVS